MVSVDRICHLPDDEYFEFMMKWGWCIVVSCDVMMPARTAETAGQRQDESTTTNRDFIINISDLS